MRFLNLILRSLFRSRQRLLLTLLSIALSMDLVATLQGLLGALDQFATHPAGVSRIIVRAKASIADRIPTRYEAWIREQPGVDSVMAMQWFEGIYQDPRNAFPNYASEPRNLVRIWEDQVQDLPESQFKAYLADRNGCLVGQGLADKFGWKLGTVVPLQGTLFPFSPRLTIRCIFRGRKPEDEMVLHFQFRLLEESVPESAARTSVLWVRARGPDDVPGLIERIDHHFQDASDPTLSETENAYRLEYLKMIGHYALTVHVVTAAVLAALLLVIGGTMAMAIRERSAEIALLRAIGFRSGQILGMLMAEGILLLMMGSLLGLGLAALTDRGIRLVLEPLAPWLVGFKLEPEVILLCLKTALVLSVFATWGPAFRATRRPIVDGLRMP